MVLLTSQLESAGQVQPTRGRSACPSCWYRFAAEMDRANLQAARIAMECDGVDEPARLTRSWCVCW